MLFAGDGVPLRRVHNLIRALPVEASIFDALEIGDRVRWNIERELATSQLELLDVIARKWTKVKRPLINPRIRPGSPARAKPLSMSDPRAREFFGAGDPSRVQYTPKPEPGPEPLGGGWYQLPDGSKVQGAAKARQAFDKLKPGQAGT